MTTAALFVAAAAAGALARAELGRWANRHEGVAWGTLAVNVTGAFLLGLVHHASPPVVTVVGTGGLGAYTTFSSFARDVVALAEIGHRAQAACYLAATVLAGVGAAALGLALGS